MFESVVIIKQMIKTIKVDRVLIKVKLNKKKYSERVVKPN